jgi:hypothetical protein
MIILLVNRYMPTTMKDTGFPGETVINRTWFVISSCFDYRLD